MEDSLKILDRGLSYFYHHKDEEILDSEVYEKVFNKEVLIWVQVLDKLVIDKHLTKRDTYSESLL